MKWPHPIFLNWSNKSIEFSNTNGSTKHTVPEASLYNVCIEVLSISMKKNCVIVWLASAFSDFLLAFTENYD